MHALLIGLLLCLPWLAWPQAQRVTIAVDDAYPPYSHVENDSAVGFYVDLVQRAMQGLPGWQLRLQPRPWVRAVQEAEQGLVDGFLPPYRGLGRDWIALYAGPLYREEIVLFCGLPTRLSATSQWPKDFAGKRIGTMRGYLLAKALTEAFESKQVSKREFRNARDALAALAAGDIDCYANDRLSIELAHEQALADAVWAARVPARLETPFVLSSQFAYIGFSQQSLSKRPELADFARALDAQLAQMRASGETQRLFMAYRRPGS